jgi:hypothetical protein
MLEAPSDPAAGDEDGARDESSGPDVPVGVMDASYDSGAGSGVGGCTRMPPGAR